MPRGKAKVKRKVKKQESPSPKEELKEINLPKSSPTETQEAYPRSYREETAEAEIKAELGEIRYHWLRISEISKRKARETGL